MKRSRSLAAFTRTKRRLIVTIATAAVLLISSCAAVAMVQFYQADYQALEQRGATRKTLDSFRALSTADGLFDMPELDTRNTEEFCAHGRPGTLRMCSKHSWPPTL